MGLLIGANKMFILMSLLVLILVNVLVFALLKLYNAYTFNELDLETTASILILVNLFTLGALFI